MISETVLQNMFSAWLSQEYAKFPDQVKQALAKTQVTLTKYPDRLTIIVNCSNPDADTDKVRELMLNQLYQFLPEYLNKSLRVKVVRYA